MPYADQHNEICLTVFIIDYYRFYRLVALVFQGCFLSLNDHIQIVLCVFVCLMVVYFYILLYFFILYFMPKWGLLYAHVEDCPLCVSEGLSMPK